MSGAGVYLHCPIRSHGAYWGAVTLLLLAHDWVTYISVHSLYVLSPYLGQYGPSFMRRACRLYSYAPHDDVSVNDGPHIRRWSHNITI